MLSSSLSSKHRWSFTYSPILWYPSGERRTQLSRIPRTRTISLAARKQAILEKWLKENKVPNYYYSINYHSPTYHDTSWHVARNLEILFFYTTWPWHLASIYVLMFPTKLSLVLRRQVRPTRLFSIRRRLAIPPISLDCCSTSGQWRKRCFNWHWTSEPSFWARSLRSILTYNAGCRHFHVSEFDSTSNVFLIGRS